MNMKNKIRELEKALKEEKLNETRKKNEKWNAESQKWVNENMWKVFEDTCIFPDSNEKKEFWLYKVKWIIERWGVNVIEYYSLYITDKAVKFDTSVTYSSCPYITHGKSGVDPSKWEEWLSRLTEIALGK